MTNVSKKPGLSDRDIYAALLMELIRYYIGEHRDIIDADRIWISSLLNGGFFTPCMTADQPGYS